MRALVSKQTIAVALLVFMFACNFSNAPEDKGAGAGDHSVGNPHWRFMDNGAVGGSMPASGVSTTIFNGKLYAIWHDLITSSIRVNVGVFDPNHSAQYWKVVNGANGLNYDPSASATFGQLAVFDSKLYATWFENSGNGPMQIRIAVFNGDDTSPSWSFVDGGGPNGVNFNGTEHAIFPTLVSFNSKLYIAWTEADPANASQIRVAVYNGNDFAPAWTFVDGAAGLGLNYDTSQGATNPRFVPFNNKLYLIWSESLFPNGNAGFEIRVKVYNGNDAAPAWTLVDAGVGSNGLNVDPMRAAQNPQLATFGAKLYAAWSEVDSNGRTLIHVKVYNGNDAAPAWNLVDGGTAGLNVDPSSSGVGPTLVEFQSKLYAFWMETFGPGQPYNFQIKVYGGNDGSPSWSPIDNSTKPLNCDDGLGGSVGQILQFDNHLYAAWSEQCPQDEAIRFAQHL